MKRLLRLVLLALAPALGAGCQSLGINVDTPVMPIGLPSSGHDENPAWIPLAPKEYGRVFESALRTLNDYGFEVTAGDANRFSGQIDAMPRVAPGLFLLFKPGSPDLYDRLLCTAQTYRHRVTFKIQPAEHGGFFVEFIARKELEDLPRPIHSTVGGAVFRAENTAERQTEVIDATFFEANWIFRGRDEALELEMMRRFRSNL